VAALAAELSLAFARPMLTDRYLVPLVPGILLGLVMIAEKWGRKGTGLAALVLMFALSLGPQKLREHLIFKTAYSYQMASGFLLKHGVTTLVFACDHPSARILDRGSMAKLGAFFLARSGHPVPTKVVVLRPGDDGNLLLQNAAGDGASILWIYNRARQSAARYAPPNPFQWGERQCNWQHGTWVGTFACGPKRN
jgi:hypothetical protein